MNRLKTLNKQKGFTIIEVIIVLAIAGLILLVVFLALPALQRNQRNTSKRSDVGRVGSAVTEYISSNNGAGLTTSQGGTAGSDAAKILTLIGTLNQYDFTATGTPTNFGIQKCVVTASACDALSAANGGGTAVSNLDKLVVRYGAKCGPTGTVVAGTTRQLAIQYATENASATPTSACQDV